MTKRLLIVLFAMIVSTLGAQTNPPDAFVYQGLAKNPGTGGIATNTNVRLKVQVLKGGPKGIMVFEENHNTRTNADGIFSVLVGRGNKLVGTTYKSLYDIPWAQDSFYFSLSMSIAMRFPPNSYSPYLPIGTQQFFTVPYAMFAKEAQHVLDSLSVNAVGTYRYIQLGQQTPIAFSIADNDSSMLNELQELVRLGGRMGLKNADGSITYSVNLPDSSSTNELQKISQTGNIITLSQGGGSVTIIDKDNQTLAISGQTLMINGGNSVTLPDKDQQTLSLSGNTVSISNGNSITLNPNDADADPNNELQTISKSGSTITLNKSGGSITDSDNQNLSVSGSSLTISAGNSVTLPDGSSTNELQVLGQTSSKGTITLSQGGGLVSLPDSSSSNELQTLSKTGSTISLSQSGGSVTDSDNQNLSLSGASLSISSGNSVTLPDASSSNELQTLTKSGSTISLSQSGGSVTDSDNQNLSLSGASLSISSGNSVTLPDASSSNEIQTLSISGNTISLSQSGGSVTVPDSDDQTLSISGNTLSISNGNSVTINTNDSDADPSNEIQTISKSGSTISLSQNGGSVTDSDGQTLNLSGNTLSISGGNTVTLNPNDADADASNEIQTLSISGNTISLSQSGGSVTVPDSDDQTLSISGNTLSISSGNSVTINPNDADADSTNEIQILSKTGNKISLSQNGGEIVDSDSQAISYSKGTVTLERGGSFNLPDTSSSNELQTLSLAGDTLKISNGNSIILTKSTNSTQTTINYKDTFFNGKNHFGSIGGYNSGTYSKSGIIDSIKCQVINISRIVIVSIGGVAYPTSSTGSGTLTLKDSSNKSVNCIFKITGSGFSTNISNSLSLDFSQKSYEIEIEFVPTYTGFYKLYFDASMYNAGGNSRSISVTQVIHKMKIMEHTNSNNPKQVQPNLIFTVDGF